ncbi:LodA/GoxA family CTQ-dependent oxidase [Synechococcus sp. PCC 7336]|uniref:LodA/GoxA family CTQ-dependent oxidase n=1 Tax=Synechococcus sp. PCC 7336 TaxID=195250 RepID=UPI00034D287E|nr:LodA/GoxA family CTQ-dependent oxidase [Synechococcus sp. PCC 7336]
MSVDSTIVRAAIYPSIGIARVGNSKNEYFIGPEISWPDRQPIGFYKDTTGALKRQAARFRIYGLNADDRVVRELTADEANITWTVHVANKKSAWYEFEEALDLPTTAPANRRNANFTEEKREQLAIDPGPISISGKQKSGIEYRFDNGTFLGEEVYLGELQTDEVGRLIFLGGHGLSKTPFPNNPPTTFANNNGWHDDTSDGPVTAEVLYNNQSLPVDPAWVVTAPPNYAPDIISVITMWDVMEDTFQTAFFLPKAKPSFMQDIYPLLQQFSMCQWVNFGFYVGFGYNQAYDFENKDYIAKLANPDPVYREYRRQIFNYFRPPNPKTIDSEAWPWMYGDRVSIPADNPDAFLSVTPTLYRYLQLWLQGDYINDWEPDFVPPNSIDEIVEPARQAEAIDKASLWFCLGGPFHPGCELTWPMRNTSLYSSPFRIRHRSPNDPEPDYGNTLTHAAVMSSDGPLYAQSAGDLTRWMAVPWQTDTASCRAGYDKKYDPWLPTFWPARVPNHVLTQKCYNTVMDRNASREKRLEAFNHRASWYRLLGEGYLKQVANAIDLFGDLGVVERRDGIPKDPDFPAVMYVESEPGAPGGDAAEEKAQGLKTDKSAVDDIPDNCGIYVGPVEKVTRKK